MSNVSDQLEIVSKTAGMEQIKLMMKRFLTQSLTARLKAWLADATAHQLKQKDDHALVFLSQQSKEHGMGRFRHIVVKIRYGIHQLLHDLSPTHSWHTTGMMPYQEHCIAGQ